MKEKLLFLHGALGSSSQFLPITDELKNDFTIFTMDFAGHGNAEPATPFNIKSFTSQTLNFIEENNVKPANIFGYSMGGYVALNLALNHPEKINKIFILGTKFLWSSEYAFTETKKLNVEKILEKVPAFAKQLEERHIKLDWKMLLNYTAEMMRSLGENNLLKPEFLTQISAKTRIGIGDNDNTVSIEESAEVKKQLQNAELEVFPATQHPIEKVPLNRLIFSIKDFFGS